MKIATLFFVLFPFFGMLYGQGSELERRQSSHDQLTQPSPQQFTPLLEEKRARLVEAISEADRESARIMQLETLDVIDQMLWNGVEKWPAKETDRIKGIRDALAAFSSDQTGPETAQQIDRLLQELLDLIGKTAR